MTHQKRQNSKRWKIQYKAIFVTILFFGIISLMAIPPSFAYQPGGDTVWGGQIYGSHQLVCNVDIFQWGENDQPWDRYRIDVWINTNPDRWFNVIWLDIDLGQGYVYKWAPIEYFYLFPLPVSFSFKDVTFQVLGWGWVNALGENTNDFRLEEWGMPYLNQEMQVAIQVPNDAGLHIKVTVTVRYYDGVKEPIIWDTATTGWKNFADKWPG